jgi:hypothetical protein
MCGCAERRILIGKMVTAARRGDVEAVKTAWTRMAMSTAQDVAAVRAAAASQVAGRLAALRGLR